MQRGRGEAGVAGRQACHSEEHTPSLQRQEATEARCVIRQRAPDVRGSVGKKHRRRRKEEEGGRRKKKEEGGGREEEEGGPCPHHPPLTRAC